jgi:hypothetical protein
MTRVHYKPGRLAMWALIWGLGGGYMLFARSDDESILDTATGIVLLAMGAFAGYAAMDFRPALTTDADGLTVRTLFARRTIRWSELLVVQIERRHLRLWGIVPIVRREYLSFLAQGGAIGSKRMRLLGSWLALPPGGLSSLRETILAARGAAGTAPATLRSAPDTPQESSAFDPDAAIARYLSAKAIAPAAASSTPTMASPPAKPGPARPSFGRRVA